jgi:hypothetical protein
MTTGTLNFDINSLPKHLRKEVADFIDYLKQKNLRSDKPKKREFGFAKGKIKLASDFDKPLDEFKDYM